MYPAHQPQAAQGTLQLNRDDQSAPPGSPVDRNNRLKHGNWFETQLVLSLAIGSLAFLTFCYSRARSTLTFAPRTHLSSFSPHPVHLKSGFFSWILPTLKTSEHTVLQIVGLDAVVHLRFPILGSHQHSRERNYRRCSPRSTFNRSLSIPRSTRPSAQPFVQR